MIRSSDGRANRGGAPRYPIRLAALVCLLAIGPCSAADGLERLQVAGFECLVARATSDRVAILWKGDDGNLLRTFPEAKRYLDGKGRSPHILMNGGIFEPGGIPSGLHRNGVGIDGQGRLVFVMTERNAEHLPNLHDFALVFRELGCRDALFLDGDISQMRRATGLDRPSNRFGTIIAVLAEALTEADGGASPEKP